MKPMIVAGAVFALSTGLALGGAYTNHPQQRVRSSSPSSSVSAKGQSVASSEEQTKLAKLFIMINDGDLNGVMRTLATNPKLLNTKENGGLLPYAWEKDQTNIVNYLASKGATFENVNSVLFTELLVHGDVTKAKKLILLGGDLKTVPPDYGKTSILHLLFSGQYHTPSGSKSNVLDLIIANGVSILSIDAVGRTPLHLAIEGHAHAYGRDQHERLLSVSMLIAKGADVNAATPFGWTPLHYASQRGTAEIVKLLLDKGADLNAKSKDGASPYLLALRAQNKETIAALEERGAKE